MLTATSPSRAIGLRKRHQHNGRAKVCCLASQKSTTHTTGSTSVVLCSRFWTVLVLHTRYITFILQTFLFCLMIIGSWVMLLVTMLVTIARCLRSLLGFMKYNTTRSSRGANAKSSEVVVISLSVLAHCMFIAA